MPKRKIGLTKSGRRAVRTAKHGGSSLGGGTIKTGSFTVSKKAGGKLQTILAPHIVKAPGGGLRQLTSSEAESRALRTGDFTKVGRARKPGSPKIDKDIAKATKMSKAFSARLGRLADKRDKRR